jgi:hypothetical protein
MGSNQQPDARGQQRSHHAEYQQLGIFGQQHGFNNTATNSGGNGPARQVGTGEFKQNGDQDSLFKGQCTGTDRGSHRVGNIVGTHTPGHEKAEDTGHDHHNGAVLSNDFHRFKPWSSV